MSFFCVSTHRKGQYMSEFITNNPLAPDLISIGEKAIAKENDDLLRQYYAEDYVFHGPGADLDFEALRGYFASLRDAFSDLRITRAIIIGEGEYLAARTIFSGVFTGVFTLSPVGRLEPHGKAVGWEVMNIFRYNADGRLAEEWVQTDYRGFLQKLGAPSAASGGAAGSSSGTP
jgi:predicted ester cyclase